MRWLLLPLVVVAACPTRDPGGEGEGEGDEGEGDVGEGEGEGEFDDARRIACRSDACFDAVVFCPDGSALVDVAGVEFAGSYVVDEDGVVVSYDGTDDVFVEADGVFVRDRDGAEFVNELVDPAVCD